MPPRAVIDAGLTGPWVLRDLIGLRLIEHMDPDEGPLTWQQALNNQKYQAEDGFVNMHLLLMWSDASSRFVTAPNGGRATYAACLDSDTGTLKILYLSALPPETPSYPNDGRYSA